MVGNALRKRWIDGYLVYLLVVSTAYGFSCARASNGWAIGEWLINYSGGFVRRGLLGEAVLLTGRVTSFRLVWIVLAVQVVTYLIFLWSVHRLITGLRLNLAATAMLLSPATLAFIVLDPPAVFKKEILLFAVLGILLCLLLERRDVKDWQLGALLVVVLPALILTHEALVLYLPYVFAALVVARGWRRAFSIALLPGLAVGCAAIAAAMHPGDRAVSEIVCRSVGGILPAGAVHKAGICSGGILWLSMTLSEAHRFTMVAVRKFHYFRMYGILAIPALAPMVWVFVQLYRKSCLRREVGAVALCSVSAMAGSIFLFYSGRDWGRWIHIHVVCLMLLALMLSYMAQKREAVRPEGMLAGPRPQLRPVMLLGLVIFTTCWNLPAVQIYPGRTGYIGLIRYLHQYVQKHAEPVADDAGGG